VSVERIAVAFSGLGIANLVAIAAFVVLTAGELAYARARGLVTHSVADSIANVLIGIGSVAFGLITVLQGFAVHHYLDQRAVLTLDDHSVAAWIAITIVVDLAFYASHRAMHRMNLFWTVHAVHHQSEQMNLLVALRIGWGSVYVSWLFYLPLALIGVTLEMTLIARGISSLYQFWLHTRLVGSLGRLDWVLVTPSHHRVHHGTNAQYLDKNYGGIFIVWDRLFGTFAAEDEPPVYGTTRPLRSHNPLWANVVEWVRLVRASVRAPRLWDKVQLWFRGPEWQPRD
jgi:alkylglycerol monooxygenase